MPKLIAPPETILTPTTPIENLSLNEIDLVRSLCTSSYREFLREFLPTVIPGHIRWNWHMDFLADELQKVAMRVFHGRENDYDLVINISPGTSKSSLTTVAFPAWVWTFMPHAKFICGSYAEQLALDLSVRGRDIVISDKYQQCFPELSLRSDQATKHQWGNNFGGMRFSAGPDGTTTGFHCDFLLIDDPMNPNMAASPAETARINHWVSHTLGSRWVNKATGTTILIMQRLGVDDPTGKMLERAKQGAGRVRHICLPATNYEGGKINPPELVDYYVDGMMDAEGLPKEFLEKQKSPHGLGEEGYAGQYVQDPLPLGGGKIKTDKIIADHPPTKYKKLVRGWDKAVTPDKGMAARLRGPAFTVGFLIGEDIDGYYWFLDVKRQRVDSATRERLIQSVAQRDGRGVYIAVEQEPGSGGADSAIGTARRLKGFKVVLNKASGSKEARADNFTHAINNGLCRIPHHFRKGNAWIGWAYDLIEEMKYWPNSTYLDQVDAGATAFNQLTGRVRRIGAIRARKSA